jgi:serine/threonine-protein kinase RsbW
MATPQPRRFEARLELFPQLRGYAERCCADAGVGAGASNRLILVLEELFANTVQHGYARSAADSAERAVWLTVEASARQIEVIYEDAAPEYDPFARSRAPDYTGPVDSWQPGGVGVALVIQMGRNVRYERNGERNRIRFMVPAPPGA